MTRSAGWRRHGRWLIGPALPVVIEIMAALALPFAAVSPAQAQFGWFPFFDRRPMPQMQQPYQDQQRQQAVDYSHAPPPHKSDITPTLNVMVLGDAMADWLGYGLEDVFSDSPEIGVTRKAKTYSGLIKSEARDAYDWPQAAREILTKEKADFIVMMIGLSDRKSVRERQIRTTMQPRKPGTEAAQPTTQPTTQPGQEPADSPADKEAAGDEQPPIMAPEPSPAGSSVYEFRSEKWADYYSKRIDDMIAALKSKGVPVFWVGLPAIRGSKSTADMVYLNDLFRSRAEKAGITYVDVWDGFVDENGLFATHGPDFEGQIRRLRASDGVYFTKAGANKLAHYAEREIRRVMLARGAPAAAPAAEEPQPQAQGTRPGAPVARPLAGAVVPLVAPVIAPEGLLGAGPARTGATDPIATRVLVKGEPISSPPPGRADDFGWPKKDGLPGAPAAVTAEPAAPAAATTEPPAPALPATASPPPKSPTASAAAVPKHSPNTPDAAPHPRRIPPAPAGDAPRPPGTVPAR